MIKIGRNWLLALTISSLSISVNGQTSFSGNSDLRSFTQKKSESNEIYFKSKTIVPENISPNQAGIIAFQSNEVINNGVIRIIQFSKLPSEKQKQDFTARGIEFIDYIPNRAFIVHLPITIHYEDLYSLGVRAMSMYNSDVKVDQFISSEKFPEHAIVGNQIRILLHYYDFLESFYVLEQLERSVDFSVLKDNSIENSLEITIEASNLLALASNHNVKFLEIGIEEGEPENFNGRTLHRSNVINTNYSGGKKYDGSGVVVMMQDDGDIGPHIDFNGRVDQTSANINTSFGNHGDHVAGIFMGSGNLDPLAEGMAPGAFGYIYGSSNIHYNDVPVRYNNDSLRITTKSYSNGCNAGYTSLTQQLDQQVVTHPGLIHVFSAGNAGTSNCGYGAGSVWGNITGGHKVGKNVIAVANLNYTDQVATSSSRGPASDGRIKPDISAKGTNVYSDDENYSYRTISGTSMSCPGVTGVLAQLYQAYKELNAGTEPNSALIKAVVLNSAEDLGNPGPDFIHGWGRINARNALEILENNQFLNSTISLFATNTHNINVPSGTDRLKIMLYWKDPAASVTSNFALVNDLDVSVSDPNSTVFQPLVLNASPNATTLNLPASPGVDNLNNMEQVVITNPTAGNYVVTVSGSQIPQGPQEYFIVYRFEKDEVTLTYPIGGEPIVPGEIVSIRWDSYNNAVPYTIEFSSDSGANWSSINSNLTGNLRYYDWQVPQISSGDALIRISQGSNTSQSHAPFSIIGVPQNIQVVWACTDSLLLSWDSVSGADSYEISRLGTKYMDSVGITNNSFFVVKNIPSTNTEWLSVKARNSSEQMIGRRAIALRKNPGSFDCPVPSDVSVSAFVSPINSQLPSCQDIDSIEIKVTIVNKGTTREGNFPVSVLLNNGSVITQQFTDTLELFESRLISFSTRANLTTGNTHFFKAWTDLLNDSQRSNDTSQVLVTIYTGVPNNISFVQNFDQFTLCPTTTNCGGTVCNLSDGWINQTNNSTDDIDWRTNRNGTTSTGTGPNSDHTGNGNYLYLEASGNPVCSEKTALLMSPCIDLSFAQLPELSFWYHMLGTDMGELHVDILANGEWNLDVTSPLIGNKGSNWLNRTVDLNIYAGQIINVRFRGITGDNFSSDLAIDDIEVYDNFSYAFDAGLVSVISPSFTQKEDCLVADSLDVQVSIKNFGTNAFGNVPLKYSLNGSQVKSGTYNNILQAGSIDTFTFNQKLSLPGVGTHHLRVWQEYGPDQNAGNDTVHSLIAISSGTVINAPFAQTFDAFSNCATTINCEATVCNLLSGWKNLPNLSEDDIDWRTNSGSTTSNGTGPSNDQNQGNALGKYLYLEASGGCDNKVAILESPCIDLSGVISPELRLWYHMFGQDIGELHFDIYLGDSWINDFSAPIIGAQANQWQQKTIDLSLFAGSVISIRVRGITEVGFAGDIAIDNISIVETLVSTQAGFTFSQPSCSGQNIIFNDNSTGTSLNYNWNFGPNATPSTANGIGPHSVNFGQSGLEDVQLIVSNFAGSDTAVQTLLLDTVPTVDFVWNATNDTVSFINQSSNATSFIWDFGDGDTSSSLQTSHFYASPGVYTVTLSAFNGCGVNIISKDITVGTVGINSVDQTSIIAYPNPNNGILYIKGFNLSQSEKLVIELYDMKGIRLLSQDQFVLDAEISLDLNSLAKGLYLLKLQSAGINSVMKIERK